MSQYAADGTFRVLSLSRLCPDFPVWCQSVRTLSVSFLFNIRILSGFFEKTLSVVCYPIGQERDGAARTFGVLVRLE